MRDEELTGERIARRQKELKDREAKRPLNGDGAIEEPSPSDAGKPTIKIVAGEVASIVDQIESAVIGADLGLYQRGDSVVRMSSESRPA